MWRRLLLEVHWQGVLLWQSFLWEVPPERNLCRRQLRVVWVAVVRGGSSRLPCFEVSHRRSLRVAVIDLVSQRHLRYWILMRFARRRVVGGRGGRQTLPWQRTLRMRLWWWLLGRLVVRQLGQNDRLHSVVEIDWGQLVHVALGKRKGKCFALDLQPPLLLLGGEPRVLPVLLQLPASVQNLLGQQIWVLLLDLLQVGHVRPLLGARARFSILSASRVVRSRRRHRWSSNLLLLLLLLLRCLSLEHVLTVANYHRCLNCLLQFRVLLMVLMLLVVVVGGRGRLVLENDGNRFALGLGQHHVTLWPLQVVLQLLLLGEFTPRLLQRWITVATSVQRHSLLGHRLLLLGVVQTLHQFQVMFLQRNHLKQSTQLVSYKTW